MLGEIYLLTQQYSIFIVYGNATWNMNICVFTSYTYNSSGFAVTSMLRYNPFGLQFLKDSLQGFSLFCNQIYVTSCTSDPAKPRQTRTSCSSSNINTQCIDEVSTQVLSGKLQLNNKKFFAFKNCPLKII